MNDATKKALGEIVVAVSMTSLVTISAFVTIKVYSKILGPIEIAHK